MEILLTHADPAPHVHDLSTGVPLWVTNASTSDAMPIVLLIIIWLTVVGLFAYGFINGGCDNG